MTDATSNPPPRNRRMSILALIVLAAALFFVAESSLYFRWSDTAEPSCVLLVQAGPALRGAEITVDGLKLPESLKATVGDKDQFILPFYLDAGDYSIRVTFDNHVQYQDSFTIGKLHPALQLDLTHFQPPATAPSADTSATQPAF